MCTQTLGETNFKWPHQTAFYRGKVRDVYTLGEQLIIIATDRISAFDHVLPSAIPYKGQVLNQLAVHFLEASRDICPNWLKNSPDPNVSVGIACTPFRVEMVIRGYLMGHAWRVYKAGKRQLCGVQLPEGLTKNAPLPSPIITPSTKADKGHDEDISREEILRQKIVSEADYIQLEGYTRALFQRGTQMAARQGLILADSKYEFGKKDGKIYLIDEIHTPDSSRYFYQKGFNNGGKPRHLSKEFVREWLIKQGFQGQAGQSMPTMPDAFVQEISQRYIELYEKISGRVFEKADSVDILTRIEQNLTGHLQANY